MIAWWWVVPAAAGGAAFGTAVTLGGVWIVSQKTIRTIRAKVQERAAAKAQAGPTYDERLREQYRKRGLPWATK